MFVAAGANVSPEKVTEDVTQHALHALLWKATNGGAALGASLDRENPWTAAAAFAQG